MTKSNEPSRGGLESLDPAQLGGLSDAQRDAIARAVMAQGPALIRQGKNERLLRRGLVGAGIAAAAAAALFVVRPNEDAQKSSQLAVAAREPAPACASAEAPFVVQRATEGQRTLEIASRVRAVASTDSQLSLVTADRCNTRLALTRGAVTVHAQDLAGGTLSVDTPQGEVQVKGTLFRVSVAASTSVVSVVEGAVVVKRFASTPESVRAGQALTIAKGRADRTDLSNEESQSIRDSLVEPSAVQEQAPDAGASQARNRKVRTVRKPSSVVKPAPQASATSLLAEAEGLWRAGDRKGARAAFRAAAADPGATGEAAWVRLARLELAEGSAAAALSTLDARKKDRGKGVLGAEATWLEVEALERSGRHDAALQTANALVRDYPSSAQAKAARRFLAGGSVK